MKRKLSFVFSLFLTLAAGSTVVFGGVDRMFDTFGAIECEDELARLDNLALELQNTLDSRAYIVVYGGKRGTYRDEVQVRGARMKRQLIETRGIDKGRIVIINGGFRETLTVEIWIGTNDKPAPTAAPTVDAKEVRFKKGKMARYREPGCFPGKYLNEKTRRAHTSSVK